jgi:hypothetical protein
VVIQAALILTPHADDQFGRVDNRHEVSLAHSISRVKHLSVPSVPLWLTRPQKFFEKRLTTPEGGRAGYWKSVSFCCKCSILIQQKRWAKPGSIRDGLTRLRPRRAKTAKLSSFCGRWADLANFCSGSGFRSRAVVPLRFSGPLVCSGPECSKLVAPTGPVERTTVLKQQVCQKEVVVN